MKIVYHKNSHIAVKYKETNYMEQALLFCLVCRRSTFSSSSTASRSGVRPDFGKISPLWLKICECLFSIWQIFAALARQICECLFSLWGIVFPYLGKKIMLLGKILLW